MATLATIAERSLRDGDPVAALAELQARVRDNPADAQLRVFLFQLLCVLGQGERALNQLKVACELDPIALAMAQVYGEAVRCEAMRREVFEGRKSPMVLGEPEQWLALLIESLLTAGHGNQVHAGELRARALEEADTSTGSIDGRAFTWIADADSRLGPILEAIVNGRYYWIPFHRIQSIAIEAPVDLRDVVWLPAHFTWSNGGELVGLIPSRYPGSEHSDEPAIRLARKTVWQQAGETAAIGLGQRMLATDGGELALLDVRRIDLIAPVADSSEVAAETP